MSSLQLIGIDLLNNYHGHNSVADTVKVTKCYYKKMYKIKGFVEAPFHQLQH